MMKKIISLLIVITVFQSCKLTDQKEDKSSDASLAPKDTVVGIDKDENGCLASAGYTWSKVNKECVRVFTGVQLNPTDNPQNEDETLSAYVLFGEDGNQAEIFLPTDTSSIVLKREAEGKPWIFQDWQLIPWKGYVLKKADKIMFSGDGEVGKKITTSDNEGE